MLTVFIASLGYFVDIFDVVLFGMVRVQSLKSLGITDADILPVGMRLQNIQLAGMLLGGIIWGIVGDKVGRVQVLFGTIFLYSIANIANAFVTNIQSYEVCRFVAGFGLAGEIGAAITIVSEVLSRLKRGIGTSIVITSGTLGAVVAGLTVHYLSWQNAYLVGGILGLVLLLLRYRVRESEMFKQTKEQINVKRGELFLLFSSRKNFYRFSTCILSGLPLFYTYYLMIAYCPEMGKELGIEGLSVATASLYFCPAMTIGDFICGLTSQYFKNRKTVLIVYVSIAFLFTLRLLTAWNFSAQSFYYFCIPTGFFIGYWAVYCTTIAEQYGTNMRSTVTGITLNFVRGTTLLMNVCVLSLKPTLGFLTSLQLVGVVVFACSLFFITRLRETFGADLDYNEV